MSDSDSDSPVYRRQRSKPSKYGRFQGVVDDLDESDMPPDLEHNYNNKSVTYSIILFHLRAFELARTCLFAP